MDKTRHMPRTLGWRGVLADAGVVVRRTCAGMLALMCVKLAFTQWGFVGVQFADGSSAYLMFLLVPVALGSLLLGTLPGTGVGLLAGAVLWFHSQAMPLDYYELAYVTPATVAMCALCGLVLGVLLSLALSRGHKGLRRAALVALACLVASWAFSAGFAVAAVAVAAGELLAEAGLSPTAGQLAQVRGQAVQAALFAGDASFQAFGDALIMAVVSVGGLALAERGLREAGTAGLRAIFGSRLLVVVTAAFMAVATAAYGAVTAGELADGLNDMASEASYLLGQVERTADYNGRAFEAIMELGGDSQEAIDKAMEVMSGGMLPSLLEGYSEDEDGLVVVSVMGHVSGVDAERLEVGDATTLADLFDEDLLAAAKRSAQGGTLERVTYLAPSDYSDLVDLTLPGTRDEFASLVTQQVGYLVAVEHGGYQVTVIRPASMVFSGRDDVVRWMVMSSVVLLAAVFALTWQLLDRMVARRIDATNAALQKITDGDLDARVMPEGTREFWDLAAGINVTVDALKGWIAEAESRMDAELATARAIQESALPSVFPPFPDIPRFDIYASMNAAKEVGGDFYDFFLLGDDCGPEAGKLAFVMADVSGKGVPAALFMMKAKTQIRDYLESGMELGEAVENANRQLCDGNDAGMFVTAWVGVLDYATGHVEYVNAGHNPPLLWQGGAWGWMRQKSGLPLGLFEGLPYRRHEVDLAVGDQLLLYTDGVTEAFSVDEEQYGEDRLLALAQENFDLHPSMLVDRVRASVAAHAAGAEQSDDITILALEFGVPPEEKTQLVVEAKLEELVHVNEFIHAELDRRLCPVRAQHQLDIAVEELFVNSCNYAYEGADPGVERYVRVTHAYSANPSSLTVEIVDDGVPFDPLAKPDAARADEYASLADIPIGGLGILMAKKNVDEMRYERVGDSNVVTLVKRW